MRAPPALRFVTLGFVAGCGGVSGTPKLDAPPPRWSSPPTLTCLDKPATDLTSGGDPANPAQDPLVAAAQKAVAIKHYGLTISGGLSIGSFEAGVSWALVRSIKAHRPGKGRNLGNAPADLAVTTGASAGNINAVISAIEWCQRDEIPDSVEDNPFAAAWLDIGLERLLPGWMSCEDYRDKFDKEVVCKPGEKAYADDDGAFTRKALMPPERQVKRLLEQADRYIPGCQLPLGVTVTSERISYFRSSDIDQHSNYGVQVPTQRYAVQFRAEGTDHGLAMRQWLTASEPLFGYTLYVAKEKDGIASSDTIVDVMEASSAFPIAFGMKTLAVCDPVRGSSARECEPGGTGRWSELRFFDGGLYDNIPLGLSMYLVEPPAVCRRGDERWEHKDGVRYLFLDPDTVRRTRKHVELPTPRKEGVPLLFDLLGRFVEVSRKYELQTALRHLLSTRKGSLVEPVTRLIPVMSSHAANFAGFFARPFRQFDYFVGVYEGIHSIADQACDDPAMSTPAARREHLACVIQATVRLHDLLGLNATTEHTKTASYVVRTLMRHEAAVILVSNADGDAILTSTVVEGGGSGLDWAQQGSTRDELTQTLLLENIKLDDDMRDVDKPKRAVEVSDLQSILVAMRGPVERKIAADKQAAATKALLDYKLGRHEIQMFMDFNTWAWHRAARLTERLAMTAEATGDATSKSVFGGFNFMMHELESPEPGWVDWNATSMSNCADCGARWARGVPYELTLPRTGGLEVGYRFNSYFSRHTALTIPVRPWSWTQADHRHAAKVGIGPLWATGWSALLSSVDVTANAQVAYKVGDDGDRLGWGVEVGTTHVLRHFRVSLSLDDMRWKGAQTHVPDHLQLRFGFSDISSLVYWFSR